MALNLALIPPYGMIGAAIATVAAYTTMFVGMAWWAQRIFPVPYQWRRVRPPRSQRSRSPTVGKLLGGGLPLAFALILVYPLALLALGFTTSAERQRARALVTRQRHRDRASRKRDPTDEALHHDLTGEGPDAGRRREVMKKRGGGVRRGAGEAGRSAISRPVAGFAAIPVR